LDRRQFLAAAGLAGLIAAVPGDRWNEALDLVSAPRAEPRFLVPGEMETLRAITARLLPGPPEDPDPGAVQARCAEAIDMLLGAFTFDPPLIYGGGPWSDRAGGSRDEMARFIPPDELQVLSWRIRLEGSKGLAEREFAGPVVGLQPTYRHGLAAVETLAAARGGTFPQLPTTAQDAVLRMPTISDFVGQVLSDSINAMYGPPEYGGNHDLVGWRAIRWPGDVQPRGYSDAEVQDVDPGASPLPYSTVQMRAVAAQVLPGIRIVD
jgi:hypothetical protein